MIRIPSNNLACRTLFLQAADDGRGRTLFGDGQERACGAVLPFVEGVPFPDLYLEFPLAGEPFLDTTVLYGDLKTGTRFASEAAAGTEEMLDWFARTRGEYDGISCGFELDAGSGTSGTAAVHFQPRSRVHLAEGFCAALGEPAAGRLYTDLAARMPEGWPLSFFGLFRGRPGAPLRVCGYLDDGEKQRCAENPDRLKETFRKIGFTDYDDRMLVQASSFLSAAPETVDFQFDVLPDGTPGETFGIDAGLSAMQKEKLISSFDRGVCARIMNLLETWGAADDRWRLIAGMGLTRSLPVENEHGESKSFALVLAPNWIKARWRGGVLRTAKAYCYGYAGII